MFKSDNELMGIEERRALYKYSHPNCVKCGVKASNWTPVDERNTVIALCSLHLLDRVKMCMKKKMEKKEQKKVVDTVFSIKTVRASVGLE